MCQFFTYTHIQFWYSVVVYVLLQVAVPEPVPVPAMAVRGDEAPMAVPVDYAPVPAEGGVDPMAVRQPHHNPEEPSMANVCALINAQKKPNITRSTNHDVKKLQDWLVGSKF